jgi:hypothetical protein
MPTARGGDLRLPGTAREIRALVSETERAVATESISPDDAMAACQQIVDLQEMEWALRERRFSAFEAIASRVLDRADDPELGKSYRDLVDEYLADFCFELRFPRALASTVDATSWQARSLYIAPELEPAHGHLKEFLSRRVISLQDAPLESSLVRRPLPRSVRDCCTDG